MADYVSKHSGQTIDSAIDQVLKGVVGKDGVSATHSWDGTVLTVTSASGTSSADLKGDPGEDGVSPTVDASKNGKVTSLTIIDKNGVHTATINDGADGATGATGRDGTSVTVTNVSTSTADGGSNVVTFSDGKTLTVKNGSKGSKGDTGATGAAGKTPVAGVDFFTASDKAAMVQEVIDAVGLSVIGEVDDANNILITVPLPGGTYTMRYENADGSTTEIGSFTVEGGGDEPDPGPSYTNLADPTSADWLTNKRINSSKTVVDVTEAQRGDKTVVVTNSIPIAGVTSFHIKGLDILSDLVNGSSKQNYGRVYTYNGTSIVSATYQPSVGLTSPVTAIHYTVADYDSSVVIFNVSKMLKDWGYSNVTHVRIGGILTGAAEDVIITADQQIV